MKIDRDILIMGGFALLALGGAAWLARALGGIVSDVGERIDIALQPRVELSESSKDRAEWLEDIYGPDWTGAKFAQVEQDWEMARKRFGTDFPSEAMIRTVVLDRANAPTVAADGFQFYRDGLGSLDDHALAKYGFYQDMSGL